MKQSLKAVAVVIAALVQSQFAMAGTDLSCTVEKVVHGSNTGRGAFIYPEVGSRTSFDVDSELVSVLRFDNGAFLAINATKIDPKDNGGWEYFWDNSSKGYVARVIYSTNGHLLIQHFTHYTNQQLGFSEYQLDCK